MIGLMLCALAARAEPPPAVVASAARGVLMIETANSQCSSKGAGFFISPTGLVATNRHVMRCAFRNAGEGVRIFLPSGKVLTHYQIGECGVTVGADLCLLKLDEYPNRFLPSQRTLPSGLKSVFTIGNPEGRRFTVTTGEFVGTANHDLISEIQVSIPLLGGNSGGPILSSDGTLIGIATLTRQLKLSGLSDREQPRAPVSYGISATSLANFEDRFYKSGARFSAPADYARAHPELAK